MTKKPKGSGFLGFSKLHNSTTARHDSGNPGTALHDQCTAARPTSITNPAGMAPGMARATCLTESEVAYCLPKPEGRLL